MDSTMRARSRLWVTLSAIAISCSTAGCGVTSLQKEVSWYKQQLSISEQDRHRLELELAACENTQKGWADRTSSLRSELDRTAGELDAARRAPAAERDEGAIRPAASRSAGDPQDFAGIEGVRAERGRDDEIRLTLDQQILFSPGSVAIRDTGKATLVKIADVISRSYAGREVRVEGHTDATPPDKVKARYPTNWELSTARASVVLRELIGTGAIDASRAAAVGYADQRPVADNATEEGRKQNRRVEVVVLGS
jgi:chemotaxis protein MotB